MTTLKVNALRSALLLGVAGAVIGFSPPVLADTIEQVTVTGTHIPTHDYVSNSPLATVSGDAIVTQGTATIESYLNTVPQFTPSLTKTNNNPQGGGAANLDLRDLGPQRTLVLVDGRRVIPQTSQIVDVSVLPGALIDRVEVITGGASAVYGSDALAGVVNIILKKDFKGVQFTAKTGISDKHDGSETHFDLVLGDNFEGGKGNAVLTLSYDIRAKIGEQRRPFSANAESCLTTGCIRSGSPTTPDGTIAANPGFTQSAIDAYFALPAHGGLAAGTVAAGQIGFNPDGSLFFTGNNSTKGVTNYKGPYTEFDPLLYTYNFNPTNLLQLPLKRFSAYATAYYDVTNWLEAYATGLFTSYSSSTQLAPTPATLTVNVNAAATAGTLPTDLKNLYTASGLGTPGVGAGATPATIRIARRTNELGPRAGFFDTNVFQLTGGLKANIPGLFPETQYQFDGFVSYGKYFGDVFFRGYASGSRVTAAASGCPSGSPSGPPGVSCTALNIFGANSITTANAAYIEQPYYDNSVSKLFDVQGVLSGDLIKAWAGPIGFALGMEYRDIYYQDVPDIVLQIGDVQGANASAVTKGGYKITEEFGEIRVPVLSGLPFAYYAGLEGGIRFSQYSPGVGVTTWKAGGEYSPFAWLKFRGMYQKAIRAANVTELFSNAQGNFPAFQSTTDPCSKTSPERAGTVRPGVGTVAPNAANVLAMCQAQAAAVNFANFNDVYTGNGQIYSINGGNPALSPEVERNYTLGFVLRPDESWGQWLSNGMLTVDYYNMNINGVISNVPATTSLTRCYSPSFNPAVNTSAAAALASPYCQAIHRDPQQGGVSSIVQPTGFVTAQNANLGAWKISGLDVQFNYMFDLADLGAEGWGAVSLDDATTFLDRWKIQVLPGEAFFNIAGTIGDGTPNRSLSQHPAMPKWKNTFRVTWNVDDFTFGWRWYMVGAVTHNYAGVTNPANAITELPATHYHYFSARWNATENIQVFGGVDNVFDQKPPRFTAAFAYTVDPETYDVIGRYFYAGITLKY